MVASAIVGGGDKKSTPSKPGDSGVKDMAAGHADVESAVAAINRQLLI